MTPPGIVPPRAQVPIGDPDEDGDFGDDEDDEGDEDEEEDEEEPWQVAWLPSTMRAM